MKHIKAHLTLSENAQPIVRWPRQVPYAIRDVVGRELHWLESTGVLKKVSHAFITCITRSLSTRIY